MSDFLRSDKILYAAVFLQAAVVLLVAFGFLPRSVILYLVLAAMFYMAALKPMQALRFFILSIPWFVAVPLTAEYDRLQSWRVLVVELLIIGFVYQLWRAAPRTTPLNPPLPRGEAKGVTLSGGETRGWWFRASAIFCSRVNLAALKRGLKSSWRWLNWVDKAFLAFLAVSLLSLIGANFIEPGLRQSAWFFNLYLVYLAARLIVRTADDKKQVVKALAAAGLTLVMAGFVQLLVYLAVPQTFFWPYWTNTIIPALYGWDLAAITAEFNSWFSYYPDSPPALRMFSLLPGSHYFALTSILTLPAVLAVRGWAKAKRERRWWTAALVFTLLAIVLTGVRGIWLSFLAPLLVILFLHAYRRVDRRVFKTAAAPLILFLGLFLASPLWQAGLSAVSVNSPGDFFWRAGSSFDLAEPSNAQRLKIWRLTLASAREQLIFGRGAANFAAIFGEPAPGQSYDEFVATSDPIIGIPKQYLSAHNLYLHTLIELGVVGLVALLTLLALALRQAWLGFKASDYLSIFGLWLGLALIWIAAHGMLDVVFWQNDKVLLFFWTSLALLHGPDKVA